MPWQKAIETGLKQKIAEKKLPVQLYVEYIDASRFPLTKTAEKLYQLFKVKYGGIRVDMVISESTPAAVMMKRAADLFPNARKLVVQSSRDKAHPEDKDLWRIIVQQDYPRAISSMIEVYHPQRLVVVADVAYAHGRKRLADFKQGLKAVGTTLPVTYLIGPSLKDIVHRTAKLPPKTAIFYLLYFHDEKGNRLTPYQAVEQIARTANAPIFTYWDTLMGSGVVGGYLLSGEKVGNKIAEAISAFMENRPWGEDTGTSGIFEHQYDWRQLQRWQISRKQLPKESRILFYSPGMYASFPVETTSLLSLIGILVILSSALAVEIRRRKKTAEQLEESRERLNAIFKASPDPIVVYDAEGKALYLNPEFHRQFGWAMSQLNDWQFPFVSQTSRIDINAMIQQVVNQNGSARIEVEGISKNENKMDMIASAARIQGKDNSCAGIVVTLTDISEQKKLEAQLRQSQKMESIGTLAGGVAHDFNNILSAIIGYTELILDDLPKVSPVRDNLDHVLKSSWRARNLVSQLLAFSRKQFLEMKVFTFNDLIKQNQSMLSRIIGEDIELNINLAGETGFIRADFNHIEQVLLNLVANARDAMPGGGKITIETANVELDAVYVANHPEVAPGPYIMLAVSDNGPGIDKRNIEKIFEPFFTTKETGKGTGMGLATVHGIVKQHGGSIYVYSELGHGTSFKVYLPRVEQKPELIVDKAEISDLAGGTETILVVEDEDIVREFVVMALEKLGYRVLEAEHGPAALNIMRGVGYQVHLLLTDVIMPFMNGKEVFNSLRKEQPGLEVLYISGYTDNVIAHHGVLDDGVAFLQKPLSISALAKKLRQVLDA